MKREQQFGNVTQSLHNQLELVDALTIAPTSSKEATNANAITTTTTTALSGYTSDSTPRQRMRSSRPLSILPRIGGSNRAGQPQEYELVEGGQRGPPPKKKFNWKLVIGGGLALFAFVALFGPRERRRKVIGAVVDSYQSWGDSPAAAQITPPPLNIDGVIPSTLSFETDPNPSKTTQCTKPHTFSKPLVQWSLIIDAGSTGSRIHVYKFHNCYSSPTFEYEVFKMTQPGLSDFRNDPEGAAKSLDTLLARAVEVVPKEFQKCTPVVVKATAGLRLLGVDQSVAILDAVKGRLRTRWPFPLGKDGVVIMDGKDEGVYAWITVNYLLNTLNSTQATKNSFAVLDLGGASTQIVFEPTFTRPNTVFEEGEHKYRLDFTGRSHVLYQHSYLGYGLMQARQSVHRLVEFLSPEPKPGQDPSIPNACLVRDSDREVEIVDPKADPEVTPNRKVVMTGADVGSFEGCKRIMELVMAKDALCTVKPCSFNGVYQPSIIETFPNGPIILLSYFYDRLSPLLPPKDQSSLSVPVSKFRTFAQQVCLGEQSWLQHWGSNPTAMVELRGRPEYCLDLTFMYTLLRLGYELDEERQVHLAKKVGQTELGWCLGAAIVGLKDEDGLVCEV
ncbi:hypothetical protein Clacol_010235 [Clathrus columnatus]|uniref:guanosine-diphosphatase n=1 Tax=Clathrus columnatus TaxID=1419009 RepID=A0AAV5AT67_9AGAM|nr:hypothetical protein Clacol_010235 [Clathrus columnatus]